MRFSPLSKTRLVLTAVVAGLALVLAACNTDPYATSAAGDPATGDDGDLLVVGPVDGDSVVAPFEVAVTASVELGKPEDGQHYLQIWFGDKKEETLTEHFAATTTIEEAPEGETTMWLQLADAEQAPVGEPISLALTVEPAEDAQDGEDQDGENSDQEEPAGGDTGDGDGY